MDKKTVLILKEIAKADGLSFYELLNVVRKKIEPYKAQQIIIYLARDGYIDVGDHPITNPFSFSHISLTGKGYSAVDESKEKMRFEFSSLTAAWIAAVFAMLGVFLQALPHVLQWLSHCR